MLIYKEIHSKYEKNVTKCVTIIIYCILQYRQLSLERALCDVTSLLTSIRILKLYYYDAVVGHSKDKWLSTGIQVQVAFTFLYTLYSCYISVAFIQIQHKKSHSNILP